MIIDKPSVLSFCHSTVFTRSRITFGSHCMYVFIYKLCLSVWVDVCLFISNKRQNGWTNWAHIFCGPHVFPGMVFGWTNFQKFTSNKILFFLILKIHQIFLFPPRNFSLCRVSLNKSVLTFFSLLNIVQMYKKVPIVGTI